MARDGRALVDVVADLFPEHDALTLIAAGDVLVDGIPVTTPRARLRASATVALRRATTLRGSAKLRAALVAFNVEVAGRVALDVGAAAGGFTTVLLEAGARRVYAVDAGHGQLLGSLRQDPRVVNLESVNLGELDSRRVPEPVELFTIDVSYLSVSAAVSQLERVDIAPHATLVALVKPMFELRAASAPSDRASLDAALGAATSGVVAAGWSVGGSMDSPVTGSRGARELLLYAVRR